MPGAAAENLPGPFSSPTLLPAALDRGPSVLRPAVRSGAPERAETLRSPVSEHRVGVDGAERVSARSVRKPEAGVRSLDFHSQLVATRVRVRDREASCSGRAQRNPHKGTTSWEELLRVPGPRFQLRMKELKGAVSGAGEMGYRLVPRTHEGLQTTGKLSFGGSEASGLLRHRTDMHIPITKNNEM